MQKEPTIGNLLKIVTLVCGMLSISISSSSYLIQEKIEDGLSRSIQAAEENQTADHDVNYLPYYLVTASSLQISIDLIQTLVFDIPFSIEAESREEGVVFHRDISYFKVLFQYIICPNAP